MSRNNAELVNDILDGDSDMDQPHIQPGNTTYVESVSDGVYKAFVRGFPSEYRNANGDIVQVDPDTVFNFFSERKINAIDDIQNVSRKESTRTMSFVVTFSNSAGLTEAIRENGSEFEGNKIEIRIDRQRRPEGGYGYGAPRRNQYSETRSFPQGSFGRDTFGRDVRSSFPSENTYGNRGNYDGPRGSGYSQGGYVQPYRLSEDNKAQESTQKSTPSAGMFDFRSRQSHNTQQNNNTEETTTQNAPVKPASEVKKVKANPFGDAKPVDSTKLYSKHDGQSQENKPFNSYQRSGPSEKAQSYNNNQTSNAGMFSGFRDPNRKVTQPQPVQKERVESAKQSGNSTTATTQSAGPKKPAQQPKTAEKKEKAHGNDKTKQNNEEDDGWKQGNFVQKDQKSGFSFASKSNQKPKSGASNKQGGKK